MDLNEILEFEVPRERLSKKQRRRLEREGKLPARPLDSRDPRSRGNSLKVTKPNAPNVGIGGNAGMLMQLGDTESLTPDGLPLIGKTLGVPVYAFVKGVPFEDPARHQIEQTANMPYVFHHVSVKPDVHFGKGACVGTVIASRLSVLPTDPPGSVAGVAPAAVGVDIGCGMFARRLSLTRDVLPKDLSRLRTALEKAVPHGRSDNGGDLDTGSWSRNVPARVENIWKDKLAAGWEALTKERPNLAHKMVVRQLGTMGTGNHFLEVNYDEEGQLWLMLHSGSRGPGNKVGTYFTQIALKKMEESGLIPLNRDLAYLDAASPEFEEYLSCLDWSQKYAFYSREIMMENAFDAFRTFLGEKCKPISEVHIHHNYAVPETHFDREVLITRKGAIRAGKGELGIIPGSMGHRSYIVEGLGNPDSFCSASHGAGRAMSRTKALKEISLEDHILATQGIECRKDNDVLDESPGAYKDIDRVLAAQSTLCKPIHTLKQLVVVKG